MWQRCGNGKLPLFYILYLIITIPTIPFYSNKVLNSKYRVYYELGGIGKSGGRCGSVVIGFQLPECALHALPEVV